MTLGTCNLLGGPFALSLQVVLAVLAFSTLLLKRVRERPPLELSVWVLNVSKQVVSLTAAHAFAILASIVLSTRFHAASECSWYLVIFSVDTIVGTALTVLIHRVVLRAVAAYLGAASPVSPLSQMGSSASANNKIRRVCEVISQCGYYGSPPSVTAWAWQAGEWTVCVLLARMACALLVALLGPSLLAAIAAWVDGMFGGRIDLQLAFVMILWPLSVNSAQALVQDAILRARAGVGHDVLH